MRTESEYAWDLVEEELSTFFSSLFDSLERHLTDLKATLISTASTSTFWLL